jgi:protein gp37
MATNSTIEWTEMTWNPVTGCRKVSQGCKNCYAERMARRLRAMGVERYSDGFAPTEHEDLIDLPRAWKKPRVIFVNSMSDLFQDEVSDDFIRRIFDTMRACPQHTFQILTKRSARLKEFGPSLQWPNNVWMGVSVENDRVIDRVRDLAMVPAKVRFLSCEPLVGPLSSLPLTNIHWVIVGGESGPGARYMNPEWVDSIHQQCIRSGTAFFFKQWGGVRKHKFGRLLNGRTYDEMPLVSITQANKELRECSTR